MRIPRRLVLGPYSYFHMTWRAHNREYILSDHREKLRYLRAMRDDYLKNCKDRPFDINFVTMMNNHAHVHGRTKENPSAYSDHMRRVHSRFGMAYNKAHDRTGKVAYDRPYTGTSEDEVYSMRVVLYNAFNPVKAGLIKTATDVKWRLFSFARYFAYGEKNEFTVMVKFPKWYMDLGKTARQRQKKFRRILDEYAIEKGYKREPKPEGHFYGNGLWVDAMKRRVRAWVREHTKKTGADPPESGT